MCRLDFYRPAAAVPGGNPLLVWFHGGGLETGDKGEERQVTFAQRMGANGVAVASANYRLSPQATYPSYIEDAAQAVGWAVRNARNLGCNPSAIHVGGESAGGYLAAMLAMDSQYLASAGVDEEQVAGFIPMSGQMMTHFTVRKERGNWNGQATTSAQQPGRCSFSLRIRTCPPGWRRPGISLPRSRRSRRTGGPSSMSSPTVITAASSSVASNQAILPEDTSLTSFEDHLQRLVDLPPRPEDQHFADLRFFPMRPRACTFRM